MKAGEALLGDGPDLPAGPRPVAPQGEQDGDVFD